MTPMLITGSAGFIGSHLRAAAGEGILTLDKTAPADFVTDIRDVAGLRVASRGVALQAVVHLAALCDVVTPWTKIGELLSTNVDGTYNVLQAFSAPLVVFASSSSVYGNGTPPDTAPGRNSVKPLSAYGASKATGELLCERWARERGTAAVALRFSNVIGEGCRGLIRYLVDHARRYPDGSEPVRLRGAGRLVRDYIPVSYVVRAIRAALSREWRSGLHVFNVSSGIPITNGQVFECIRAAVGQHGLRLCAQWAPHAAEGEADHVVLDPESMLSLGIAAPTEEEIMLAAGAAVEARLGSPSPRQLQPAKP